MKIELMMVMMQNLVRKGQLCLPRDDCVQPLAINRLNTWDDNDDHGDHDDHDDHDDAKNMDNHHVDII